MGGQDDRPCADAQLVALAVLAAPSTSGPTITEILANCPHPTVRRGSFMDHARQFPETQEDAAIAHLEAVTNPHAWAQPHKATGDEVLA